MDCQDARSHLLDYQRGRLAPAAREEVHAHLETCAGCATEEADGAGAHRTPRAARAPVRCPARLKRRLAARWPEGAAFPPSWWIRWGRPAVPALAVAAVLLAVLPLYYQRSADAAPCMVAEAVNDHLRFCRASTRSTIESGACTRSSPGSKDGWTLLLWSASAAIKSFHCREAPWAIPRSQGRRVRLPSQAPHDLPVRVPCDGLPWPTRRLERVGNAEGRVTVSRGFNVILWRSGELGYALVSDLDRRELGQLAAKIAG